MPSMRVVMLPGLFETQDEVAWTGQQLLPLFTEEARAAGYSLLATATFGPIVVLSRKPVHTLDELRNLKLWMWGEDSLRQPLELLNLKIVPAPLLDALKHYENGDVDGFLAIPAAALAFQWSAHARYLIDLRTRHLVACLLVANRAMDALSIQDQRIVRSAAAKAGRRIAEVGREQDALLLGGLFARQGMTAVPVSAELRSAFFNAAHAILGKLDPKLVPQSLIARVEALLAEHRRQP
jgi:TRAP-type C4-dicarboxylate transport system substrate-binding protein